MNSGSPLVICFVTQTCGQSHDAIAFAQVLASWHWEDICAYKSCFYSLHPPFTLLGYARGRGVEYPNTNILSHSKHLGFFTAAGHPLQYLACRILASWEATVHGVTKSWTRLSDDHSLTVIFTVHFKSCDPRPWVTWLAYLRVVVAVFPLPTAPLYHLQLLVGRVGQTIDPTHAIMTFCLADPCVRLRKWCPLTKSPLCSDSELTPNPQKTLAPWKKSYDKPREHTKKQRYHLANKSP